jgi:hypothetical protein
VPTSLLFGRPQLAVAVTCLLGFGVLIGSAVSPAADSDATRSVVVALSSPPPAAGPAAVEAPSPAPARTAAPEPAQVRAPAEVASGQPSSPKSRTPSPAPGSLGAPVDPFALPPIRHVFLIVLSDQGYTSAFGPSSMGPYLARTLTAQGELFPNYFAVASGELANGIALLSGQGPKPQTAANCPQYVDLAPAAPATAGQFIGAGCVYPTPAHTLADQLIANGLSWRAYVEGLGGPPSAGTSTCPHPASGAVDERNAPRPGEGNVTWRNPFVYFHSLTDSGGCATNDVGLDRLPADLKLGRRAPSLSYIVPSRCDDGSEQPCATGQPSGLPAADAFLRRIVPEIQSSPAYRDHGLIAITFDQAPQSGPGADASACCGTPQYPNLPPAPVATSGSATPSPSEVSPTGASAPSTSPAANAPASALGPTTPSGGGGQVGLLLISSYVQPGTVNPTDYFNHYSLLRSLEDVFNLEHLGYAADPALPAFDKSVFNAKTAGGKQAGH